MNLYQLQDVVNRAIEDGGEVWGEATVMVPCFGVGGEWTEAEEITIKKHIVTRGNADPFVYIGEDGAI